MISMTFSHRVLTTPCAFIAALIVSVSLASDVQARSVTHQGSGISNVSGALLSASAEFEIVGSDLVITLTNTGLEDVLLQPDILTAMFFDVSGPLLGLNSGLGSAVLPVGSSVLFGGTDPGGVVGGEWAYAEGISGALSLPTAGQVTQNYGISSVGFGVFGGATFPGSNLQGPGAVDGLQYGITSAGDNPLTGQPAITGVNALIQNSVVFTLAGLPVGFTLDQISNVFFQYGTALVPTDPGFPGDVPAPGALVVFLAGAIGMRRRARC
jgi:hypothetical protein